MQNIVGASVSSSAMDAQARAERLVWRGWCNVSENLLQGLHVSEAHTWWHIWHSIQQLCA